MCEKDHNLDDREVTNCLIDLSEVAKYVTDNKTKVSRTTINDWSEEGIGLKKSYENVLKTNNTSNVKKKRIIERSLTDLTYGNTYSNQNQGDDYWSNSSTLLEHKPTVRCIGDDFETFPIPPWKSNIEQGTCRYIHDNGSYRTLKFMYDDRKDWYTMRKKRPEKVSTTWHHTCKRMQREMKRQLKKELATAERERDRNSNSKSRQSSVRGSAETRKSSIRDSTENRQTSVRDNPETRQASVGDYAEPRQSIVRDSAEATSGDDTQSTSRSLLSVDETLAEQNSHQQLALFVGREPVNKNKDAAGSDLKLQGNEYQSRHIHKKETRVRSTHSDGAVNQKLKMKTIHESEPVTPVPHYSIPSGSQMIKSASDLFIENFSTRISALEDEIKKDSKWLRKNENELTKIQNNRAKYRDVSRSTFKEGGTSSITPRGPVRTEHLTSDIFSVKPMAQKELKPLEKIKNGSKTSNIGQNGDYLQNEKYGTSPNRHNYNSYTNGNNFYSEFDRGTSYKAADDISNQGLFNTLTGTKINTQNNKKTSKGFSTPSTITICDNSSNNGNTSHANDKSGDSYRPIPIVIEKKSEKRGALQNVPALLPEISGKRLEPTSVPHRLL